LRMWFFMLRLRIRSWFTRRDKRPLLERQIMALMLVLDPDRAMGITVRATPEEIERLKASDSPFAGYVISCLVPPEESEAHYDDWMRRSLERTNPEIFT
jgi:hypothetical protein